MSKQRSNPPAFPTDQYPAPTDRLPWRVIERNRKNQALRDYRCREIPGFQIGDQIAIDKTVHNVVDIVWHMASGDCVVLLTVAPSNTPFAFPKPIGLEGAA